MVGRRNSIQCCSEIGKNSASPCGLLRFSREEGVSDLDREARFANLLWICGGETHKLRPEVIDNKKIAIGPVIVTQANVENVSIPSIMIGVNEDLKVVIQLLACALPRALFFYR